jgi:hypothetical protein
MIVGRTDSKDQRYIQYEALQRAQNTKFYTPPLRCDPRASSRNPSHFVTIQTKGETFLFTSCIHERAVRKV